jgi:hypothetical protein
LIKESKFEISSGCKDIGLIKFELVAKTKVNMFEKKISKT